MPTTRGQTRAEKQANESAERLEGHSAHTAIKREGVSDEEPEHVFIRTQTVKKQEYGAEVGRYRWREMTSASQESQKLATSGKTKPGSELFTLDLKTEELTVQSLSQESGKSNRKRTSSTKTQQFISATSTANAGAYPMQQTGSLRLGPAIQHPWTSGTGESYPQQHMPYDPSFAFTSTFPTGPDVQKPSEPKRSHNKRKGGDHVARPPNAFLLFRRDFILNKRVPGIVEGDGKNLSVIAGAVWKNMGANEQARWYGLAKIEKEKHQREHPDYVYRPDDIRASAAARTRSKRPSTSALATNSEDESSSQPTASTSGSKMLSKKKTNRLANPRAIAEEAYTRQRLDRVAQQVIAGFEGDRLVHALYGAGPSQYVELSDEDDGEGPSTRRLNEEGSSDGDVSEEEAIPSALAQGGTSSIEFPRFASPVHPLRQTYTQYPAHSNPLREYRQGSRHTSSRPPRTQVASPIQQGGLGVSNISDAAHRSAPYGGPNTYQPLLSNPRDSLTSLHQLPASGMPRSSQPAPAHRAENRESVVPVDYGSLLSQWVTDDALEPSGSSPTNKDKQKGFRM